MEGAVSDWLRLVAACSPLERSPRSWWGLLACARCRSDRRSRQIDLAVVGCPHVVRARLAGYIDSVSTRPDRHARASSERDDAVQRRWPDPCRHDHDRGWNSGAYELGDGPAKRAIVDFVRSATTPGPGFVPVADRIATFDNDGTLWVEQPMPPQLDFVFRKWEQEIKADPSLASQQPYKAIIEKDPAFFEGVATQDPEVVATLLRGFARSWAGTTPDEFDAQVRDWLRRSTSRSSGCPTCSWSTSRCSSCSSTSRRTSSGCSCAPAAAATSCACSPRRPGESSKRT